MASNHYFNFIGDVWKFLPSEDRDRLAETWQAYEQIFAAAYQNFVEADLNITLDTMLSYSTERWLPYVFDETNFIARPAILTGNQDLSNGLNLSNKYLFKFSVDGGSPIEVDLRGVNPLSTTIDEIIYFLNVASGFDFARGIFEDTIIQLVSSTNGVNSLIEIFVPSDPLKDATEYIFGILQSELPLAVPIYPWTYTLPYSKITDLPNLRDAIRDESVTVSLDKTEDFELQANGIIGFKEEPPSIMWAKRTLFDQEVPYNNFGFLIDIYQRNTPSFKTVLQGLWFAFWTGPKPESLRRALYLLFGLPVAQEDTMVTKVTETTITTTSPAGVTRNFEIPIGLISIVSEGEELTKFQPLVDGIEVFDKINHPGFVTDEIGRAGIQRFLLPEASRGPGDTDETKALIMLEEHTFLPQISVDAFISPDISLENVQIFLRDIKPLSKTPFFQVIVGNFRDEMVFGENLTMDIDIDVTPNLDGNQTTWLEQDDLDDYETTDDENLDLDSDGLLMQETVAIEVYDTGGLIDSFVA